MNRAQGMQRWVAAAIIAVGAAAVGWLGGWESGLVAAVAGALAVMVRGYGGAAITVESSTTPFRDDILSHPDFAELLDAQSDSLLIIAQGRVAHANRAALRLLGSHIPGADARIAIRHPAAAEQLASTAPLAEPVSIDLVGPGTREQQWEMRIAPLSAQAGEDRRIIQLIDRSVSRAAERMRVDFVANASHELRTPLAAILGFIETLTDPTAGEDAETRERFLKIMDAEARRMDRLVDDLISLSRIEADKYRAPDAVVDLRELAAEVTAVFRESHRPRGQDVALDIDGNASPVRGDRAQLSQLLHNLVGNSAKYGRTGTPITVRVTPGSPGLLKLVVSDQGDGIAPDHLPRLTERFYRVDSGRSRSMGGTGLGLAIVKHIVERHRGRLDIASIVGRGTTITVLLPVADPDQSRPLS